MTLALLQQWIVHCCVSLVTQQYLADNNVNKQHCCARNNGRASMVTGWMSVNFYGYNSRVWRSVGCGRVHLAADSFEVGRLSSYRKL
jgi:hypothetical protein